MHVSRRTRLLALLLVVPLAAALLVATAPADRAVAAPDPGAESDFVGRINAARAAEGLPRLTVASDLVSAAREHARDMAAEPRLYHNPDLASDICCWQRVAENVGVGYSVSGLHSAFMGSSGHRANILDDRVTQVGVGVEVEADGRIWVTQVFRLPAGASPPEPAPEPEPEPEPAPSPTRTSTPAPSPSPTRTSTPRPSPSPTRTSTPAPSPTASRTPTPAPSPTGDGGDDGDGGDGEGAWPAVRELPRGPWTSSGLSVR